jgi:YteA family regulatory protein
MSELNSKQLNQLKQQLLDEKADLERRLDDNGNFGLSESQGDSSGELSMYDNHPADTATGLYEREKDIALNEHAEFQLNQLNRSLENMAEGDYGICVTCGTAIPFERLEAIPTTEYCIKHSVDNHVSDRRPVEEEFLNPPFGRTSLDEQGDQNQFDGEDAWQIVESWGNSDSPAMAEDPEIFDYDSVYIEADEPDGYVEPIESFLATDLYGNHVSIVRNREYRRYMASNEGDHELETDPPDDHDNDSDRNNYAE